MPTSIAARSAQLAPLRLQVETGASNVVHKGAAGLVTAGGALKEGIQGGIERLQTLSQVQAAAFCACALGPLSATSAYAAGGGTPLPPGLQSTSRFAAHPSHIVGTPQERLLTFFMLLIAGQTMLLLSFFIGLPAAVRKRPSARPLYLAQSHAHGSWHFSLFFLLKWFVFLPDNTASRSDRLLLLLRRTTILRRAPPPPAQALFPTKFAIPFTIGSGCNMGAIAALRGYRAQAAHMMSKERLPFSTIYVGSMLATLWSAIVAHSYILCMLSSMARAESLVASGDAGREDVSWLGRRRRCGVPCARREVLMPTSVLCCVVPLPPQVQVVALFYYMFSYFPGVRHASAVSPPRSAGLHCLFAFVQMPADC